MEPTFNMDLTNDLPEIRLNITVKDGALNYELDLPGREFAGRILPPADSDPGLYFRFMPWNKLITLVISEVTTLDSQFKNELSERFMLG